MKLRDYQVELIKNIYAAWDAGHKNVGVQLATGGGKTVIFSTILKNHIGNSIVIAHRSEILSQISLALSRACVRHKLIAQKPIIREIVRQHVAEMGCSYHDARASCCVAAIDTLLNQKNLDFKKFTLIVQDEAHHVLCENKWGKAAAYFSHANGLYPTATPVRADGKGLGRNADGVIDVLITGVKMRELIDAGHLTEYRIISPPTDIDLSNVSLGRNGDYSAPKLRTAVHKSKIVGDVVSHYLKFAAGKQGITFAVSIESATDIMLKFREAAVPAEIVTGKTSDYIRADIMRRFRNREILQIVNVDLLGEGVDVPAIEVVSFARPTQSYALYAQQFGRALRTMPGKKEAIIIDHVNNVVRHGLPDKINRVWSLERRDKRSTGAVKVLIKTCLNPECLSVYDRYKKMCPYCNVYVPPAQRSTPDQVDGDLTELTPDALKKLRDEVEVKDAIPALWPGMAAVVENSILKNHRTRVEVQHELRNAIALYAGHLKQKNYEDHEIYKLFYLTFNVDILSAQKLNTKDSEILKKSIDDVIDSGVI